MSEPKARTKYHVLRRDKRICVYCGGKATTVDHKIPVAQGGTHNSDNLVAACKPCNVSKGSWASYALFKRLVSRFGRLTQKDIAQFNRYKLGALNRIWGNVTPIRFYRIVKEKYPQDYQRLIHRYINSRRAKDV